MASPTTLTITVPELGTLTLNMGNIGTFTLAPGGPGPGGTMKNVLIWTIDLGASGIATIRFTKQMPEASTYQGYPGLGYDGVWVPGSAVAAQPAIVMKRMKRRYVGRL